MKGYFSNKWNVSRVYRVSKIKRQLQFIDIDLLIDMLDNHFSKSISYFSKISFHFYVAIHNDQSL